MAHNKNFVNPIKILADGGGYLVGQLGGRPRLGFRRDSPGRRLGRGQLLRLARVGLARGNTDIRLHAAEQRRATIAVMAAPLAERSREHGASEAGDCSLRLSHVPVFALYDGVFYQLLHKNPPLWGRVCGVLIVILEGTTATDRIHFLIFGCHHFVALSATLLQHDTFHASFNINSKLLQLLGRDFRRRAHKRVPRVAGFGEGNDFANVRFVRE